MRKPDFRDVAFTWQQVLCVLLVATLIVFGIMAGQHSAAIRNAGFDGVAVAVPLLCFFAAWHIRDARRPDVLADVLVQLFPSKSIFQAGQAHVLVGIRQAGHLLHVRVFVQNTNDGPGIFTLSWRTTEIVVTPHSQPLPPALSCELSGGAVVMAETAFPLKPCERRTDYVVLMYASCRAKGRKVRFARRPLLTETRGFKRIGVTIGISLDPVYTVQTHVNPSEGCDWEGMELWSPLAPMAVNEMMRHINGADTAPAHG